MRPLVLGTVALVSLSGCQLLATFDRSKLADAQADATSVVDANTDAAVPDADMVDVGTDSGVLDAATPDGSLDSGLDAEVTDAGELDAGELDAGNPDAGELDAGNPDAGPTDAGPSDAGETCTVAPDCDDDNNCTTDTCEDRVCVHAPNTGDACDDALYCTVDDACTALGECTGTARSCDLSCTTAETCDETTDQCVRTLRSGFCFIGESCVDEGATGGLCLTCNPEVSTSAYVPVTPGTACDDGLFCTTDTLCDADAVCTGSPLNCADSNPCSVDACDESADRCRHVNLQNSIRSVGFALDTRGDLVRLRNPGVVAINLDGYYLCSSIGNVLSLCAPIPTGTTIPPGMTIVISPGAAGASGATYLNSALNWLPSNGEIVLATGELDETATSDMVCDYLQWGTLPGYVSALAVDAGEWTSASELIDATDLESGEALTWFPASSVSNSSPTEWSIGTF